MVIPTLDKDHNQFPLVEGGYWPFSFSRAGGYKDKYKNTLSALSKILPRVSALCYHSFSIFFLISCLLHIFGLFFRVREKLIPWGAFTLLYVHLIECL
jgi:hypothetical protein